MNGLSSTLIRRLAALRQAQGERATCSEVPSRPAAREKLAILLECTRLLKPHVDSSGERTPADAPLRSALPFHALRRAALTSGCGAAGRPARRRRASADRS